MKRWMLITVMPALMLLAPPAARAGWMGLSDGDYLINLECTQSTVIACPSITGGTLTVTGTEVTAMSVTIDAVSFSGDPFDGLFSGTLVDFEGSSLQTLAPFRFLSLRLITDGQIGSFGTGDRWWVYCSHAGNDNSCAPNTTGLWTATLLNNVPEPPAPALVLSALALAAARAVRRRC